MSSEVKPQYFGDKCQNHIGTQKVIPTLDFRISPDGRTTLTNTGQENNEKPGDRNQISERNS